jgi:aryl-alcohol dehydrogenase-like predicted oxidoreductase
VMLQYSLLDRRPEEEVLDLLNENQIGVLARGSVAKGLLISKTAEQFLNYSAEEVERMAKAVKFISGTKSTALETCVQFVLGHPGLTSAVIGIRTAEQLEEALAIRDAVVIQKDQFDNLRNILPANKYTDHR